MPLVVARRRTGASNKLPQASHASLLFSSLSAWPLLAPQVHCWPSEAYRTSPSPPPPPPFPPSVLGNVREGDRVAVHYDLKFRNITLSTSRQGAGVTGGNPYGFDVGGFGIPGGPFIKGMDLGVQVRTSQRRTWGAGRGRGRSHTGPMLTHPPPALTCQGMGKGQVRRLIVPPELGYGNRAVQDIPANATLTLDLELLSIKAKTPFGWFPPPPAPPRPGWYECLRGAGTRCRHVTSCPR